MSLLEPFRKLWNSNKNLKKQNDKLLEENRILLEEVKMLKKIMYSIELDVKNIFKK